VRGRAGAQAPSTGAKNLGDRVPIIYILGDIRSGSSLLERVLTASEATIATGEQRVVWLAGFTNNNLCSCGAAFDECQFWKSVCQRLLGDTQSIISPNWMARSLPKVDRLRLTPAVRRAWLRPSGFVQVWDPIRNNLAEWYRAIHLESVGRVIIDSSKSPAYGMLLGTIPSLDVMYVHLARDSRGVAFSSTRAKSRPEITSRPTMMDTFRPWQSALRWAGTYSLAMNLRAGNSGRVLEVQYENLVQDPDRTVHSIREFAMGLGLPDIGDQHGDTPLSRYHSVAGNPMRFTRATPTILLDDEWRTQMRWRDRALVTSLTAPFLLRHHWLRRRGFQ